MMTKLERRWGRFAIQNLTFWIMIGQIFVFGMETLNELGVFRQFPVEAILFLPEKVLQGEVWRMLTYVFQRPGTFHPLLLIFVWGIFYMTGNALEAAWGAFRYNLFILVNIVATILGGFLLLAIFPKEVWQYILMSNFYLLETVFLGFAYLNPNIEFRLFLVLPVKVKWLGFLALGHMAYLFIFGGAYGKVVILSAMVNLVLFLGKEVVTGFKMRQRRVAHEKDMRSMAEEPFHTCVACGATDKTHPERQFYYSDGSGYCEKCQDKMPD